MIKSGNSLGINVLSGLVKVERGVEAERSGLSGRRPISVSRDNLSFRIKRHRANYQAPSMNRFEYLGSQFTNEGTGSGASEKNQTRRATKFPPTDLATNRKKAKVSMTLDRL